MSNARRVADRWLQSGLGIGNEASDEALDTIERLHGVKLPASFRGLWTLSDGTGSPDAHWLIFFQVSDLVQPLYAPRDGSIVRLLFADWQQSMATFALELNPMDHGVVVIGNAIEPLAPSFDAFLDLYLCEARLWPRPTSS